MLRRRVHNPVGGDHAGNMARVDKGFFAKETTIKRQQGRVVGQFVETGQLLH